MRVIFLFLLLYSTQASAVEITVSNADHLLVLKNDDGTVESFPAAIGRQGAHARPGQYRVTSKRLNPSWRPTPHMLSGRPSYSVPPGPHNPLGAAKLYLDGPEPYIGIHGTNDSRSFYTDADGRVRGRSVSHGCIRLRRPDILYLYKTVPLGTVVNIQ